MVIFRMTSIEWWTKSYTTYVTCTWFQSPLGEDIMRFFHDNPLVGHHENFRIHQQIRDKLFLRGLENDVSRHVRECMTCQ